MTVGIMARVAGLITAGVLTAALATTLVQCSPAPPPAATHGPAAVPSSGPAQPATVVPVSAEELGASWRRGCPVGPERLRRVRVSHLGFDGRPHRGELIVHEQLTAQVIAIFERLYRLGYPIEKMRTVERYRAADDELSMADNNTSAFNCRDIPGSRRWAQHAYGRAIDLNPLLNPYISDGDVRPKNARVYLDRHRIEPGLLHHDDPAVRVFTDRGWRWGGHWKSPVDYQHFELR